MENTFITCASSFFGHATIDRRSQLDDLSLVPPAIVYVREDGNYYLRYFTDPAFESTPYYSKHGNGWHPLDVSSPRFDRPIHIINSRWVQVNGMIQDLDYLINKTDLTDDDIIAMSSHSPIPVTVGSVAENYSAGAIQLNVSGFETPIYIGSTIQIEDTRYTVVGRYPAATPPEVIELDIGLLEDISQGTAIEVYPLTDLGNLPPEHFILRVGREDMNNPYSPLKPENNQWYITSVECYKDHPESVRTRWCWNVMQLYPGNWPARFDRVIHFVESEIVNTPEGEKPVTTVLQEQKKIIPGDILFDRTLKPGSNKHRRRWDYVVSKKSNPYDFIPIEFARELIVLSRDEFNEINKYFQLTRLYIINLTHGSQFWTRYIPVGFDDNGETLEEPWWRPQYPAEFCYWSDYD